MEFTFTSADGSLRTEYVESYGSGRTQTVRLREAGDGPLTYRSVWSPLGGAGDIFKSAQAVIVPETGSSVDGLSQTVDGYRGIWFTIGQSKSEYGDKYSGGLGTYTMKHIPMAVYSPEIGRAHV